MDEGKGAATRGCQACVCVCGRRGLGWMYRKDTQSTERLALLGSRRAPVRILCFIVLAGSQVVLMSAREKQGIDKAWDAMCEFRQVMQVCCPKAPHVLWVGWYHMYPALSPQVFVQCVGFCMCVHVRAWMLCVYLKVYGQLWVSLRGDGILWPVCVLINR